MGGDAGLCFGCSFDFKKAVNGPAENRTPNLLCFLENRIIAFGNP